LQSSDLLPSQFSCHFLSFLSFLSSTTGSGPADFLSMVKSGFQLILRFQTQEYPKMPGSQWEWEMMFDIYFQLPVFPEMWSQPSFFKDFDHC
jgi:hypothetical protein